MQIRPTGSSFPNQSPAGATALQKSLCAHSAGMLGCCYRSSKISLKPLTQDFYSSVATLYEEMQQIVHYH